MRSVELHVIETDLDIDHGLRSGLLEVEDVVNGGSCTSCYEDVGNVDGTFYPFAIALDETDDSWFVCVGCASSVLEADSSATFLAELIDEEDFEEFDLDDE